MTITRPAARPIQPALFNRDGSIAATIGNPDHADYWPWAAPTKTPASSTVDVDRFRGHHPVAVATAQHRAQQVDYPDWLDHVKGAAACRRPIRLSGAIHVTDREGTVVGSYHTDDMPDGVIYTPCGNRRASVCPACADTYRRDTYHLIRAGLTGDRWGLPPLDEHLALFLTATPPSFGLVHHRVVDVHAADCRRKDRCTCRPKLCRPFGKLCAHGRPKHCRVRHRVDDPELGTPLCVDCYDHAGQVVWNHEAPELWRRTLQEVRRNLERLAASYGVEVKRRYLKIYEFQVRGAIHYHALIRLDGIHPDCPDAITPPPRQITRTAFNAAVEAAFVDTWHVSPPHPANGDRGWTIRWGKQLDLKHVNAPGGSVNADQLTGYLAKYVTKDTAATGFSARRVDDHLIDQVDPDSHVGRLLRACWTLGAHPDWWRLRRYAHQYGYGGHITSKSRNFSVTYRFIRLQRTIWRRTQGHPDTWRHEQETARVITELGYHATGWITTGDALLANTAAALARQHDQAARDALAEPYAGQPLATPKAA